MVTRHSNGITSDTIVWLGTNEEPSGLSGEFRLHSWGKSILHFRFDHHHATQENVCECLVTQAVGTKRMPIPFLKETSESLKRLKTGCHPYCHSLEGIYIPSAMLATLLSSPVLPHFILTDHLYKVGIIRPVLQLLKPSSVRWANLPHELVSQLCLPQHVLQGQETQPT